MTTETRIDETARPRTVMMANNRLNETTKQLNMMATSQADEMSAKRPDTAIKNKNNKTGQEENGVTNDKEPLQSVRERDKEEEEKLSGLWDVRARFKNLAENILPKHPYLMGIPSKIHITRHEGPDWRRGTPFSPHEERMQYVSFQRLDDDETVLRPQAWDEENAKSPQSGSTRRNSSEFSSGPGQTPRKKMSVEEYMRKKNPGSANAIVSREGSIVPPQAEAKVAAEGNIGLKAQSNVSPFESTASKVDEEATHGATRERKTQATSVVARAEVEIVAKDEGVREKDVTTQRATIIRSEVTSPKPGSTKSEVTTQKSSAVPKETHTPEMTARKKEVAVANEGQLIEDKRLHSRKR